MVYSRDEEEQVAGQERTTERRGTLGAGTVVNMREEREVLVRESLVAWRSAPEAGYLRVRECGGDER